MIADGTVITHIYTLAGTYTVTVEITDTVGGSVVGTASDALTLTVEGGGGGPSPEALVNDLICAKDDLTFAKPQYVKAMMNKLNALKKLIDADEYAEAYDKLQNDINPKLTLGDKHSWITGGDVSDIITELLEALTAAM